jgi:large repetitive protein
MSDINVTVTNAGAAKVAVSGGSTVNATVGNGGAVNVSTGTISPGNATVVSGTLAINSVTTLAAGSSAYVKNDAGTAYAAKLDIGIPAGPATNVTVGSTTTIDSGNASVTGTTSGNNLTLAFAIPRGATGDAGSNGTNGTNGTNGVTPTITASATTLSAGSSATVTATTSNGGANVALAFGIPRGSDGAAGSGGGASLSDATPSALGTASAGTSTTASRSDHVHLLPSLSTLGAAAASHSHNYVTALNSLTGALTLAAGTGVTLTASGSTITISSSGSGSSDVDGGDYTGTLVYDRTITITQQPTDQSAVSGAATVSVTATASPSGTLAYQWQLYQNSAWANVTGGTSSSLALTGLTNSNNGDRYRCVISAQSAASVTSGEAVIGVNATAPGAPTNISAVRGASSITLSWTAPTSNGGASITDYVVQYDSTTDAAGNWATFSDGTSTATSATITGLAAGYYYFRVAAVNAIGQSAYTQISGSVFSGPALLQVTENTLNATASGFGDSASPLVVTCTSETQTGVVVISSTALTSDTKNVDWGMQVTGGPVRFYGGDYDGLVVTSSYTASAGISPSLPFTIRPDKAPFSLTFTATRSA